MTENETQQCRADFDAWCRREDFSGKSFGMWTAWQAAWTASRQEGRGSDEKLKEFAINLAANQKPLEPEFAKVLQDNYWELLEQSNPASTKPDTASQTLEKLMPLLQNIIEARAKLHRTERTNGDLMRHSEACSEITPQIAAIINGNGRE